MPRSDASVSSAIRSRHRRQCHTIFFGHSKPRHGNHRIKRSGVHRRTPLRAALIKQRHTAVDRIDQKRFPRVSSEPGGSSTRSIMCTTPFDAPMSAVSTTASFTSRRSLATSSDNVVPASVVNSDWPIKVAASRRPRHNMVEQNTRQLRSTCISQQVCDRLIIQTPKCVVVRSEDRHRTIARQRLDQSQPPSRR